MRIKIIRKLLIMDNPFSKEEEVETKETKINMKEENQEDHTKNSEGLEKTLKVSATEETPEDNPKDNLAPSLTEDSPFLKQTEDNLKIVLNRHTNQKQQ